MQIPDNFLKLNHLVMSIDDEDTLLQMIEVERATNNRPTFVLRIHSRYNKLRAARERGQILAGEAWRS